jgi:integrase/recombinase XerC
MALTLADKDPLEVNVEDLRDVIDLWADREARTRAKVTSIIRAFWAWAEDQGHVLFSPAAKLRRPRAPRKTAALLPVNSDARLLNVTTAPRDRAALLLLLDAGLRRSELTGIRVQDIDLSRRQVTVFGKGQKSRVIPIRGRIVYELEHYVISPLPFLDRPPEPDDFLLYPEKRTAGGRILVAYPKRRMSGPTVHRWWYRHLQAAGLVGSGMTSGLNMHRARHSFAAELRRVADLGAASQALGHSDLSTTASIYGHYDLSDLEKAMEALAKSRRASAGEPAE